MVRIVINIMLIGCGYHARRIHVPVVESIKKDLNAKISVIVDIKSQRKIIDNFLSEKGVTCDEVLYIDSKKHKQNNTISESNKKKLNSLV